jgi:hypothetical protein
MPAMAPGAAVPATGAAELPALPAGAVGEPAPQLHTPDVPSSWQLDMPERPSRHVHGIAMPAVQRTTVAPLFASDDGSLDAQAHANKATAALHPTRLR